MGGVARLFGGGQTTTQREPVTRVPDEQDTQVAQRRQREIRRSRARRTFADTNLSGGALGDTSGGNSGTLLG